MYAPSATEILEGSVRHIGQGLEDYEQSAGDQTKTAQLRENAMRGQSGRC